MQETVKIENVPKVIENYKNYTFGREKISIPCTSLNLSLKKIEQFLPEILKKHYINAAQYTRLEKVVRGQAQNINKKTRDSGKEENNNIVIENHALAMTQFKQGYLFGNKIKYSSKNEDNSISEELKILTNYFETLDKGGLDNNMAYGLFVGGVANRLILPKKSTPEDETPFEIFDLDYSNSFVVYSSGFTKEKLFGVIINNISKETDEILIYTKDKVFTFERNTKENNTELEYKKTTPHFIGYVPMVEYITSPARLGTAETVESMLDGANAISSDCIDNISDFVNAIFYVKNMRIDEKSVQLVNQQKAIEILTNDPSRPADAGYIVNKLDIQDVQQKYDSLITNAYDIVGVPRASQSTSSGGDTGEARMLGGGWVRAEVVAMQEQNSFLKTEKELLKVIISICKKSSSSAIKSLSVKDIEVVFSINMNTNLLVKTQSLQYLITMNMPKEEALKITQLTSNPHEVAMAWENKVLEMAQKQIENTSAVFNTKQNPLVQKTVELKENSAIANQ